MRRLSGAAATAEPTGGLERGNRGVPAVWGPPSQISPEWPRGAFPPLHLWWARVGSLEPTFGLSGEIGGSPPFGDLPPKSQQNGPGARFPRCTGGGLGWARCWARVGSARAHRWAWLEPCTLPPPHSYRLGRALGISKIKYSKRSHRPSYKPPVDKSLRKYMQPSTLWPRSGGVSRQG